MPSSGRGWRGSLKSLKLGSSGLRRARRQGRAAGAGQAGVYTLPGNRPGLNMTQMAPLGPSQVDIGYLGNCRW